MSTPQKPLKIDLDTKTFIRFWLVPLGFLLCTFFIFHAAQGLFIIAAALFIALAIDPLVKRIAKIIPGKGVKLPIALAYVLVVGFIITFLAIVIPTVFNETIKFISNFPNIVSHASFDLSFIDRIGEIIRIPDLRHQIISSVSSFSQDFADNFLGHLSNSIGFVGNIGVTLLLALTLAFFMLVEGPDLMKRLWRNYRSNPRAKKIRHVINRMTKVVSLYVSGALTVGLINACATAIFVFILSFIFSFSPGLAFPFGLITGTLCLIPMFGSFLGECLVALLLSFNNPIAGLVFFIYACIYPSIEGNIISPKVQGRSLRLPPLVILASITIGIYTFSFLGPIGSVIGAIVAIPIAGCIKILMEEYGDGFTLSDETIDKARLAKSALTHPRTATSSATSSNTSRTPLKPAAQKTSTTTKTSAPKTPTKK
ncbi:AI-2E family transporter [Candidatus Saccharibacteria bacterium]|nr:AI-2E family transporter [Candidatus Saccharibacteria bacterium]